MALPTSALPGATSTALPAASTPDGFKLQHPGIRRNDYLYDSDTEYQVYARCTTSSCGPLANIRVQFNEYLNGGYSNLWRLTANMSEYDDPGNLTWSYSATYYCGVNVKGASDHECDNGADPSGESMSVNEAVWLSWGNTDNITVFPMVAMSTLFSDGGVVTTKFRGWDALNQEGFTELATKSGDGN
jgi:hypothetical protein